MKIHFAILPTFISFLLGLIYGCEQSPKHLTRNQVDILVANSICNTLVDIYNQNVAGRKFSGGEVDASTNGPLGGFVRITGSVDASKTGPTATDLTYEMSRCRNTKIDNGTTISVSLIGIITWKGSFDTDKEYKSVNIQSEKLIIAAAIKKNDYKAVSLKDIQSQ